MLMLNCWKCVDLQHVGWLGFIISSERLKMYAGPCGAEYQSAVTTHTEQRWLNGVVLNQDWGSGCRCQCSAHPSCCWFFWASEWWAIVSRLATGTQLQFQPLSERQGADVQTHWETQASQMCHTVKRQGGPPTGRGEGELRCQKENHTLQDGATHKEGFFKLDFKPRNIFWGIKVSLNTAALLLGQQMKTLATVHPLTFTLPGQQCHFPCHSFIP